MDIEAGFEAAGANVLHDDIFTHWKRRLNTETDRDRRGKGGRKSPVLFLTHAWSLGFGVLWSPSLTACRHTEILSKLYGTETEIMLQLRPLLGT